MDVHKKEDLGPVDSDDSDVEVVYQIEELPPWSQQKILPPNRRPRIPQSELWAKIEKDPFLHFLTTDPPVHLRPSRKQMKEYCDQENIYYQVQESRDDLIYRVMIAKGLYLDVPGNFFWRSPDWYQQEQNLNL